MIKLKRAYEERSPSDGFRVLVERLWPRGVTKERAAIDLWIKDITPSPALRKWFGHKPGRWLQFKERYWKELCACDELVGMLRSKARSETVTFVYAAKDEIHNGAIALKEFLESHEPVA